jgi:hypothetical protein
VECDVYLISQEGERLVTGKGVLSLPSRKGRPGGEKQN